MNNCPLVSVLMPAYNAERFISEAISSILNQDYTHLELLILDDASTDNTLEVIQSFTDSRIKLFRHQKNKGYLISCNELFDKAKGDFITFQDADDTCSTSRITECLAAFESDKTIDFLTTGYIKTDVVGNLVSEHNHNTDYHKYGFDPNYYPTICCATAMVKSSLLKKVGGYHLFFKDTGGEDYFWLYQLSKESTGIHISNSTYHYRQHVAQISQNHTNDNHLFIREILTELKLNFIDETFNSEKAKEIVLSIRYSQCRVSLRKVEAALNQNKHKVAFRHWAKALLIIRFENVGEALKIGYFLTRRTLRKLLG